MFKLKKFQIEQDYVDFADSEQFVEPNVSYISATEDVKYTADRPAHDYSQDYLTIESYDQYGYIELNTSHAYYSLDGGNTWEQQSGSDGISISSGQKCMLKYDYDSRYGNLSINFYDTRFKVYGNILSIADSTNFRTMTSVNSGFNVQNFFNNSNVVDAENLVLPITWDESYSYMFNVCTSLITAPSILPASAAAYNCYYHMFDGCTSLTTAPELPATNLDSYCYKDMFSNCTSLTTAPELPATNLAYGCYENMFSGCTSLTTAPELPATTLAEACYQSMFSNCTSLTTAPELPTTNLTYECYNYMFQGCSSLNYIKCLATTVDYSTEYWVEGVAQSGTFVKNPNMSSWTTGDSGIPEDWTVQDA